MDTIKHLFSRGGGKKNKCVIISINSRVDVPDFRKVKNIASVYCYELCSFSERYEQDSKLMEYRLVFSPI
jgi:hypothetical protein